MTLNFSKHDMYQMFYLKKAILEQIEKDPSLENTIRTIHIDHKKPCNYINNQQIPLLFPLCLKNYIEKLPKTKTKDYHFIGTINSNREWLYNYTSDTSLIEVNRRGRDPEKKFQLDKRYYETMCASKFTLTPTGDYNWSYRFFEAIMCFSIPVFDSDSLDVFKKDYFYYTTEDNHVYHLDKAVENYNRFINSSHFLSNLSSCDWQS